MSMTSEDELKQNTRIMVTLGSVVAFLFFAVTSCTVHMNMYNPGEAKVETAKVNSQLRIAESKQKSHMERLRVMEKMIVDNKIDPIAAHCAIEGWHSGSSDVCLALVTPAPAAAIAVTPENQQ